MTHRERAEQIYFAIEHGDEQHRAWLKEVAIPKIEAALIEVEKETTDQCCDYADEWSGYVEVDNAPCKPSIYIKQEIEAEKIELLRKARLQLC